jgi:hypothetical protein
VKDFSKPLAFIAKATDVATLKQIIENTKKLHGEDCIVVRAARERIAVLLGSLGVLRDEFEVMRQTVIKVTGNERRLSRLLKHRDVIGALEYLMAQPITEGFRRMVEGDCVEQTAEAIVLRHPGHFSQAAISAAHARLPTTGAKTLPPGVGP